MSQKIKSETKQITESLLMLCERKKERVRENDREGREHFSFLIGIMSLSRKFLTPKSFSPTGMNWCAGKDL